MQSYPIARELVLAGGGHTHVIFLRMLGMRPIPGLSVTLVSPELTTPYSGMLPGVVAGHYQRDEAFIELGPLCRFAGASLITAEVTSIDLETQQVHLPGRPPLHYDVLSLDVGSTPKLQDVSSEEVVPVKPISSFLGRWDTFVERLEYGVQNVGFVGSGAGGVELCLAVRHYLDQREDGRAVKVHLCTDGSQILSDFEENVRQRFVLQLEKRGIEVHYGFRAVSAQDGELLAQDGRQLNLDEIFWVTQAGAQPWMEASGLAVDERGFVNVQDTLQSVSHENVFAVGDCSVMVNHPRPRAGVFAVRQGKPLYNNVRAYFLEKPLKAFKPQSRYLALISTGDRSAVASRNGFSAQGSMIWRWKDIIDRRFMDRFRQLPVMKPETGNALLDSFDEQMRCGGCGSKVSIDVLQDVISALLPEHDRMDDAAIVEIPAGRVPIQSVDHFRGFVNDPYVQARVAVSHALSDIYACGGTAHSAMAMITLPFGKPDVLRSLLEQVMTGAVDQLAQDHVTLIGGHTSEGMELSIGFAVNGSVKPGSNWTNTGLREGDLLVTNKALGVGAIFAADMQFKARGRWVAGAVTMMLQSNRAASQVLRQYDVSACTDITGFGLAGHCLEMLDGDAGLEIFMKSVQSLPGAMACLNELGIRSTLHEANRLATGLAMTDREAEILFDPQTSGGLLAGIPAEDAPACVEDLKRAGYAQAAVIGRVTNKGRIILNFSEEFDG